MRYVLAIYVKQYEVGRYKDKRPEQTFARQEPLSMPHKHNCNYVYYLMEKINSVGQTPRILENHDPDRKQLYLN